MTRLTAPVLAFALATLVWASPAAAAPDKGDTAFLMVATVLVMLMTIPGLALFYCGLVRTKIEARNQDGRVVMSMLAMNLFRCRR